MHSQTGDFQESHLERWKSLRQPVMRMAIFTGPTMHLFLIIIAGLTDTLLWYVWFALVFGTLWGLVVLALKFWTERKFRLETEKE